MLKAGLGPRRDPSFYAVGPDDAILDVVGAIAGRIVGMGNRGSDALEVVGVNGAFPHVVSDLAIGRQAPEETHPIVPSQQVCAAVDFYGIEAESREFDRRIEPFLALSQALVRPLFLVDVLDEDGRAADCSCPIAKRR